MPSPTPQSDFYYLQARHFGKAFILDSSRAAGGGFGEVLDPESCSIAIIQWLLSNDGQPPTSNDGQPPTSAANQSPLWDAKNLPIFDVACVDLGLRALYAIIMRASAPGVEEIIDIPAEIRKMLEGNGNLPHKARPDFVRNNKRKAVANGKC